MFTIIDALLNKAEMASGGVSRDDIETYAKLVNEQPVLTGVYSMVKAVPKVAEYLKKRPNYEL